MSTKFLQREVHRRTALLVVLDPFGIGNLRIGIIPEFGVHEAELVAGIAVLIESVANEEGQFLTGILQVFGFARKGVGALDLAGDVDGLGAQRIAPALAEDHPSGRVGEVLLALDGVFLVQVAEPLDFGQGIEGRAFGMVILNRLLDGSEQLGLDTPAGLFGQPRLWRRGQCQPVCPPLPSSSGSAEHK